MSLAYLSAGRFCRIVAVILLLISSAPSAAAPGLSPASDGPVRRKILVDNDDLVALQALGQSDALRLADYGSFSLWSLSAAESQSAAGTGRARRS